tara:strand:- start:9832 stop:10386 length:555 start_codon:yes stop_codon:yes gene_type:complete
MEIFEVNGNVVRPTANILNVSPFKEIWKRDKSKTKNVAMQEFAFIEFMVSKKKSNPFKGYDEEIKEDKIKEKVIVEDEWEADELVVTAIDMYKEWQFEASPTIRYYEANLAALSKTINYLTDGLDYEERNRSGMPVHKFNDVVRGIKEADQVLKSLTSLRRKVEEELYEASKTVGNKEINPYER